MKSGTNQIAGPAPLMSFEADHQHHADGMNGYHKMLFSQMLNGLAYHRMIFENDLPVDYVFMEVNEAFERLTNLKNVVGKKVSEIIPGIREADPKLFERYGRVAKGGQPEKFETFVESLHKWFTVAVYSPRIDHFVTVFEDITERKQADIALTENEDRFRAMFEMASIGMAQANPDTGQWIRVNSKMCSITGFTEDELLNKKVPEITHPDDRERDWALFQQVVAGKKPDYHIEKRYIRKDGSTVWVNVNMTVLRCSNGKAYRTMATIEDISKRKASEAQLTQLSRAVYQSPVAIVITDPCGIIQFVNPKFCEITGYTAEESIGQNPRILKSGETPAETYELIWKTITAGQEWRGELHNRKKNGELFWERASISPITDKEGVITNFLAVKEDITEHKLLAEQFLRAQRIENIGTLASGISHDLNNILAPIMMAASMLDDDLPAEMRKRLASSIYEAAQRGSDIVKQVLSFARGVKGNKTVLKPDLLIAQAGRILRETLPKTIAFSDSIPDGLWSVSGDVTQLHQVLLNLSVNARDAMMPHGGTLTITAANIDIDENYAATSPDAKPGRYVVIKVIDSGCGIPAAVIDKIFNPFFTTKETGKGTGLGLSTAMGIIKSHNGFVEVSSQVGRGSVFRVFIPAVAEAQPDPFNEMNSAAPKGSGETILLVDDETEVAKVATLALTQNGYVVKTAADGVEALTIYARNSNVIKVVVTDVMMPLMDGVNLTRALKKMNPALQIIATSGHLQESRENELKSLGIHAFLWKPYNNCQLLQSVHNAIQTPAAG